MKQTILFCMSGILALAPALSAYAVTIAEPSNSLSVPSPTTLLNSALPNPVMQLASTKMPAKRSDAHRLVVNLHRHEWCAYAGDKKIRCGVASGGAHYCPDKGRSCHSPIGSFSLLSKGGPGCRSTRYPVGKGGAPMPFCMFFSKLYAVHGSYDVPKNRHASHGCIRIKPDAAYWLSKFLYIGSRITILPY